MQEQQPEMSSSSSPLDHLLLDAFFSQGQLARQVSSGLFRSRSGLSGPSDDDKSSDSSDGKDGQVPSCSSNRRITIAKQILAEATTSFTPDDAPSPMGRARRVVSNR